MRAGIPVSFTLVAILAVLSGTVSLPAVQNGPGGQGQKGRPESDGFATLSELPSLRSNAEARAVNAAGTVIVGLAFDRQDILHAVKWTLQNGAWRITTLPMPSDATSAQASGVNDDGDVAGYSHPHPRSRALLWPSAGGMMVLGCDGEAGSTTVYGIAASARILVGSSAGPSLWRPGQCREPLPVLVEGLGGLASAVNGDGTIVGGAAPPSDTSFYVPVRWRNLGGQWTIEPLDTLEGGVRGANAAGDLSGYVNVPCGSENDCQRAVIWYAAGGSRQLGTLGGNHSWANDVNADEEAVGVSTSPTVGNTAFFWSEAAGMLQLPFKGQHAVAFAVSDVRADGTRLAVGVQSKGGAVPVAWVIRNQ